MNTGSGRPRPRKGDLIFLVNRCLAPEVAYEICKMDGLHGIPLCDHYGDETAQGLEDIAFLTEAGQRGWGVLTQSPRMWQVPQSEPASSSIEHGSSPWTTPTPARPSRAWSSGAISIRRRLLRPDPCFWRLGLHAVRKDLA